MYCTNEYINNVNVILTTNYDEYYNDYQNIIIA